jgi:hypothetical protein
MAVDVDIDLEPLKGEIKRVLAPGGRIQIAI